MNFDPVPEHEMLRDSVREFFARELPESRIREMDRARKIPREIWKRFAALGWTGLSVPAEYGGSGADVSTGSGRRASSQASGSMAAMEIRRPRANSGDAGRPRGKLTT